jgi:4-amino-4-deoxy-L-arabinose transferase-like glycosyltransferase
MPLTSIVSAAFMWLLGPGWRSGQVPMVVLSALLVPMTYVIGVQLWRSRRVGIIAAILAVFAGPLLVMYPNVDNFAVFGVCGAGAIYFATRAVTASSERHALYWLVASGAAGGLATLARIDGLLLSVASGAAALVVWRRGGHGMAVIGLAAAASAFIAVMAPWLARNLIVFGSPLPSAGGHTLFITSYNEQFSISHDPTLTSYLAWGLPAIVGSKLASWWDLVGRTTVLLGGIFVIPFAAGLWRERRRPELLPFISYFVVMFIAMGAVFTFHAPKGAFYHSAPAWLPFALPLSVAALPATASAAGRYWKFLRRPATHRFLAVAGVAGAIALSLAGSAVLLRIWSTAHQRDVAAGTYLAEHGLGSSVVLHSDPASLWWVSGNPGVAGPFDGFPTQQRVIDAYHVEYVVVTLRDDATRDPLGFWDGAAATDADGNHPSFLSDQPVFEAPGVRIYRVVTNE